MKKKFGLILVLEMLLGAVIIPSYKMRLAKNTMQSNLHSVDKFFARI